MNWRIKGIVQKLLSGIPGGMRANDLLQRSVGELRHFDSTVDSKVVDDWLVLAGHLRALDRPIRDLKMLEIGTGWFPTLPFCFFLAGAAECHTFDLYRHLSDKDTQRMIRRLQAHLPALAEAAVRPVEEVKAAYAGLDTRSATAALRSAGITYHAPADAASTGLPPGSIDVAFSNSVLEHVPRDVIQALFHEQCRILKPGGLSVHSVNCGDHYAYFDRSLNPVRYLTYSDREWSFWNNDLLYQNRLRPRDFLEMASTAGLELALVKFTPKAALLRELPRLRIAKRFEGYSPEELCTTSIDFVARRPG